MDKKDAVAKLEAGLHNLLQSDNWRSYLSMHKHFHNYSWNNKLLIWVQMPEATRVAGFQTWKKLKRYVNKGAKGIAILAPIITSKDKEDCLPDEEETKEKLLVGFRIVHVFDVSQTSGEPLPDIGIHRLEGNSDIYERMLAVCPFPVQEIEDLNGANGMIEYTSQQISVLASLSSAHKAKTLAHEWAHGLLHVTDPEGKQLSRDVKELEAESTAFIVCDTLGLDTSGYSFGYLVNWNGDDAVDNLKQSLTRIQKAADRILQSLPVQEDQATDSVEVQTA